MTYQDVNVGGVVFRLSLRERSDFVGVQVASGGRYGEIFGFVSNLGTDRVEARWFRRLAYGWPRDPREQFAALLAFVERFHAGQQQHVEVEWRAAAR